MADTETATLTADEWRALGSCPRCGQGHDDTRPGCREECAPRETTYLNMGAPWRTSLTCMVCGGVHFSDSRQSAREKFAAGLPPTHEVELPDAVGV